MMKIDYSLAPSWATEVFCELGGSLYYYGNLEKYAAVVNGNLTKGHVHSPSSLQTISDKSWRRIQIGIEENE